MSGMFFETHCISAFAFPAEAGTHLPTPEGWKAELALCGGLGYIPK